MGERHNMAWQKPHLSLLLDNLQKGKIYSVSWPGSLWERSEFPPKTENEALKWDVRFFFLNLILTWAHVLKICKTITWHKLVFCSCTPPIPPSSGKVPDSADLGLLCVHPSPRSLGKDCAAPAGVWIGSSSPLHRETAPYFFSPKCRVWSFLHHSISVLAAPSRNPSPPRLPVRTIPIGIAFKFHKILYT